MALSREDANKRVVPRLVELVWRFRTVGWPPGAGYPVGSPPVRCVAEEVRGHATGHPKFLFRLALVIRGSMAVEVDRLSAGVTLMDLPGSDCRLEGGPLRLVELQRKPGIGSQED